MAAKRPVRLCDGCGKPCRPEAHTGPPYKCRVCKFAQPDILETLTEAAVPCGLSKQPKYRGEWIVCADLHIPLHDPHALAFMCAVAQKYGIRQLGIAGDLTHYDTLGRFAKMRKPTSVSEDVTRTVQVLGALERVFDTIVVAPGNHDHRVEKSLAAWRQVRATQALASIQQKSMQQGTDSISVGDIDAEIKKARSRRRKRTR